MHAVQGCSMFLANSMNLYECDSSSNLVGMCAVEWDLHISSEHFWYIICWKGGKSSNYCLDFFVLGTCYSSSVQPFFRLEAPLKFKAPLQNFSELCSTQLQKLVYILQCLHRGCTVGVRDHACRDRSKPGLSTYLLTTHGTLQRIWQYHGWESLPYSHQLFKVSSEIIGRRVSAP